MKIDTKKMLKNCRLKTLLGENRMIQNNKNQNKYEI